MDPEETTWLIDPEELAWLIENGEDPGRHAILPPMLNPTPPAPLLPTLEQLAIAAVRATLDSTGAWARLPEAERRAVMGRMRWELGEAAGRAGVELGSWVMVGPSDPPPSQPGP